MLEREKNNWWKSNLQSLADLNQMIQSKWVYVAEVREDWFDSVQLLKYYNSIIVHCTPVIFRLKII